MNTRRLSILLIAIGISASGFASAATGLKPAGAALRAFRLVHYPRALSELKERGFSKEQAAAAFQDARTFSEKGRLSRALELAGELGSDVLASDPESLRAGMAAFAFDPALEAAQLARMIRYGLERGESAELTGIFTRARELVERDYPRVTALEIAFVGSSLSSMSKTVINRQLGLAYALHPDHGARMADRVAWRAGGLRGMFRKRGGEALVISDLELARKEVERVFDYYGQAWRSAYLLRRQGRDEQAAGLAESLSRSRRSAVETISEAIEGFRRTREGRALIRKIDVIAEAEAGFLGTRAEVL